jgi:hypothetical protein
MTPILRPTLLAAWLGFLAAGVAFSATTLPGLAELARAVGPPSARAAIGGIAAQAEASGPRGAFRSEVLSLTGDSARFRLTKGAEATEILLAAGKPFQRAAAGGGFEAADAALASFVRGHEVHRMLLDLEQRFRPDARAVEPGCLALRGPDGLAVTLCRAGTGELPGTIALELPAAAGGGSVTLELGDWRSLPSAPEVQLPFTVDFLHGSERHTYRYTTVLPFRLAPGIALPEAPDHSGALSRGLRPLLRLRPAERRRPAPRELVGGGRGRGPLHATPRAHLAPGLRLRRAHRVARRLPRHGDRGGPRRASRRP